MVLLDVMGWDGMGYMLKDIANAQFLSDDSTVYVCVLLIPSLGRVAELLETSRSSYTRLLPSVERSVFHPGSSMPIRPDSKLCMKILVYGSDVVTMARLCTIWLLMVERQ